MNQLNAKRFAMNGIVSEIFMFAIILIVILLFVEPSILEGILR